MTMLLADSVVTKCYFESKRGSLQPSEGGWTRRKPSFRDAVAFYVSHVFHVLLDFSHNLIPASMLSPQDSTSSGAVAMRKKLYWGVLPVELTTSIIKETYQQSKPSPLISRALSPMLATERVQRETHASNVYEIFSTEISGTTVNIYGPVKSLALVSREWAHIIRPHLLRRLQVKTPGVAIAIVEHAAAEVSGDLVLPFKQFVQHLLVVWAFNADRRLQDLHIKFLSLGYRIERETQYYDHYRNVDTQVREHPEMIRLMEIKKARETSSDVVSCENALMQQTAEY